LRFLASEIETDRLCGRRRRRFLGDSSHDPSHDPSRNATLDPSGQAEVLAAEVLARDAAGDGDGRGEAGRKDARPVRLAGAFAAWRSRGRRRRWRRGRRLRWPHEEGSHRLDLRKVSVHEREREDDDGAQDQRVDRERNPEERSLSRGSLVLIVSNIAEQKLILHVSKLARCLYASANDA
jgi:hypothetical protein